MTVVIMRETSMAPEEFHRGPKNVGADQHSDWIAPENLLAGSHFVPGRLEVVAPGHRRAEIDGAQPFRQ